MKTQAVSLETREADLAVASSQAELLAAQYVEAKASGQSCSSAGSALDEALRVMRAADRRLAATRKRLASH